MSKYPFPKIDLHCHLDGAIQPATLFELGMERGIALPADTAVGLVPYVVYDPAHKSVNEYLKKFDLPLLILQDAASLERIAFELVCRQADEGLAYAEIRFAPQQHTRKGLTQRAAAEAVAAGLRRGEQVRGTIKTGLLVCAMCLGPAETNRAANLETAILAVEGRREGWIAGFDLAGAEGVCDLADFAELFDTINAAGVPATCHAGDSQGPDTVRTAIERFGVRRIGHGHHIYDDPALCQTAIEKGVTLEVCITSNIQCMTQPSYAEHPIRRLYEMGMRVTLNTDNPVIADVTLDSEYDLALSRCGFTPDQLIQMNIYAAQASFLPEAEKQLLIARLRGSLTEGA